MLNLFRIVSAILLVAYSLAASPANAQKPDIVLRSLPDKCDLAICWTGSIKPDADGAAPEKWLAQPEMQQMFAKLKSAISKFWEANSTGGDDQMTQKMMAELPWLMMQQPWAIYAPSLANLEKPPENFAMLLKLGEKEGMIKEVIDEITSKENLSSEKIFKSEFYAFPPKDDFPKILFGIHRNFFMFGIGEDSINELFKNAKSPVPKWATELQERIPVDRLGGLMHVNVTPLWNTLQQQPSQWQMVEATGLNDITGIEGAVGIRNDEMLTHATVKCPKNENSLLSLFSKPLSDDDLKQIPDGTDSAFAVNLSVKEFWAAFEKTPLVGGAQQIDFMLAQLVGDITIKQLIENHLTGFIQTHASFDLVNPTASTLVSIGIRDAENLRPKFEKLMDQLGTDAFGLNVEIKESSGVKIYTVSPKAGGFGPPTAQCFCLAENYLYFGMNPRAITSHIRKAKRDSGKLIEKSELQVLFDDAKNGGLGRPLGIQYFDTAKGLQLLSSFTPLVAPFLANSGFDFDISTDIPSGEILANGVSSDRLGIYRNDDGIHFVEHHTTPGLTTIGIAGVGVGMLLPAVQQTRAASRRVMSANNMRQMVLGCLNFESAHRNFPPAYSMNEKGEKLLSWRVHLLPFFEQEQLYQQFKLDEPWDSVHNRQLIEQMPKIFLNPNLALEPGYTIYLGVTGEKGAFAPPNTDGGTYEGSIGFGDIIDGASNTILIVEANQENAVPWTKPSDLDIDQVQDLLGACRGVWPGSINVAFCDGSCHSLIEQIISNQELRVLMTYNGGEIADMEKITGRR